MDFVALDVETANADLASICQIGVARYVGGSLIEEWSTLVDPEDYFDPVNIRVHGITEQVVAGGPTFPEAAAILDNFLGDAICVSHTSFDRISIKRALDRYGLPQIGAIWLDSARVARRTWEKFALRGYGLASVCNEIGYEFKHHDALEDAKAAARILLAASEITGLGIESWLERVKRPIYSERAADGEKISRKGNPEGDLYGELLVFTGALGMPRKEAADLAASVGCTVASSVTKQTTLLVVGDQDVSKLAGKEKSSKHLRAEALIREGQSIRILRESDFKELIESARQSAEPSI